MGIAKHAFKNTKISHNSTAKKKNKEQDPYSTKKGTQYNALVHYKKASAKHLFNNRLISKIIMNCVVRATQKERL